MDRVKAAIFSSLGGKVVGARVLDLFAGSGALGIEALSRGASSALFVDEDRRAIETIERNLAKTKNQAKTRRQEVFEFLQHPSLLGKFDIIFADPPYDRTEKDEPFTEKLLIEKALPSLLEADGIFILEKRPGELLVDDAALESGSPKNLWRHRSPFSDSQSAIANPQSAIRPVSVFSTICSGPSGFSVFCRDIC